jgi:hypothetical protein
MAANAVDGFSQLTPGRIAPDGSTGLWSAPRAAGARTRVKRHQLFLQSGRRIVVTSGQTKNCEPDHGSKQFPR